MSGRKMLCHSRILRCPSVGGRAGYDNHSFHCVKLTLHFGARANGILWRRPAPNGHTPTLHPVPRMRRPPPNHENPIHRPAAATVNHRASDTAPTTLPRTPGSRLSWRATRSRTAKVNRSAMGRVIIFTQNEVL